MKIFLVRHGYSDFNEAYSRGRMQIERTANFLKTVLDPSKKNSRTELRIDPSRQKRRDYYYRIELATRQAG